MAKVINDVTKFMMLSFTGTILGSTAKLQESIGTYKGTIVSEASFRQFVASKGENAGKTYGCLECNIELENGNTIKCRIESTSDLQVGDICSVEITEDKGYKNALVVGKEKPAKVEAPKTK